MSHITSSIVQVLQNIWKDRWFSFLYKPEPIFQDEAQEFFDKYKKVLVSFANSGENLSSNIDQFIYNREDLYEILLYPNNSLEKKWKARILIMNTPVGNICMFYDIFKHGFSYYCDRSTVPYKILNSVAMNYVKVYQCYDFFMDEQVLPSGAQLPLYKIFFEEKKDTKAKENKESIQASLKDAPFAKLKNYAIHKSAASPGNSQKKYFKTNYVWFWRSWYIAQFYFFKYSKLGVNIVNYMLGYTPPLVVNVPTILDQKTPDATESTEPREKKINKFIYIGHFRNCNVLQKHAMIPGFSTKYDAAFKNKELSYKDFKNNQPNILCMGGAAEVAAI